MRSEIPWNAWIVQDSRLSGAFWFVHKCFGREAHHTVTVTTREALFCKLPCTAAVWPETSDGLCSPLTQWHTQHQHDRRDDMFLTTSCLPAPNVIVCMGMEHGLAPIATLRTLVSGKVLNKFGGLIFVRKDSSIQNLTDITGKIVTAISIQLYVPSSLLIWSMQRILNDSSCAYNTRVHWHPSRSVSTPL